MLSSSRRILYLGTEDGLYFAEPEDGGFRSRALALQGKGAVRSPVVVDRADPRLLYAGTTRAGVYRSEDAGLTWREINDGIIYKEVWSIAQHPRTGELFAGTGPSSIFKSRDGGDTWIDCAQLRNLPETIDWTFPRPPHVSHVKSLALSANDPDVVFGAVEEGWVIRSRDGGETWQNLKDGVEFDAHCIALMPDNENIVIVTSGKGVYRSENGGENFTDSSMGLACRYMAPFVVHPARPATLFTAAAAVPPSAWRRPEGAASAFYRSDDQGKSWERLSGGLPSHFRAAPRAVAVDPEDPDTFLAGMTDGTVWLSENGGASFRQILGGLPQVTSISVAHR
ncbi:MAG TPA: hypothetical protein VNL14_11495 [Candidatus Acidoferrales bacterium]|nr:hypothetical protein [Candidatus Acidoferrales bacterium]